MKKYWLILFLLLTVGITCDLQAAPPIPKKIIVGINNDYAPYEYINRFGNPAGFNVELIKGIAREMQFDVEFKSGTWAQVKQLLDSGKVDLVSMFFSADRAKTFAFSVPHSTISFGVFFRKNQNAPNSENDFISAPVLTQNNDLIYNYLKSKNYQVVGIDSADIIIRSLSNGQYNYALISKAVGLYYAHKFGFKNLSFKGYDYLNKKYCFAAKKKNIGLIQLINEGFLILKQSGKYNQIVEDELQSLDYKPLNFWKILEYGLYVFIPLAFTAMFLIFWNWQLRNQVKKRTDELKNELNSREKNENLQYSLYKISESAAIAENLKELYIHIHDYVAELVPASNFYIALYDKDKELITFPYFIDEFDQTPEPINPGKTLTGYVLKTGEPLLAPPDVFLKMCDEGLVERVGAPSIDWLGIPLKNLNQAFGALVVQSYTEGIRFSDEDKNLLVFVSNQIANAIIRRKSFEEIQILNKELEDKVKDRTARLEETMNELKFEIEEKNRTQKALEQAQTDIELALIQEKQLNEMKSRFISTVSHEYRTPLTIIMSSSYLLEKYFDLQNKNDFVQCIKKIHASVDSMTKMLDEVLLLDQHENTRFRQSVTNLLTVCKEMVNEMSEIDKNKHSIRYESNKEQVDIFTDPELFKKIIQNLLSNAIKFSPENSEIVLSLYDCDESCCLSVHDQGIGIPREEREHLFLPYHRFKNVGAIPGSGLGLSIVKKYVDFLGGTISIESEEHVGTTFEINFPKRVHLHNQL